MYFGDNQFGNQIVPMGLGGAGGGVLYVTVAVPHSLLIDLDKMNQNLFSLGDLYFGDNQFGNQIVPMGLGGAGVGLLYLHS